MFFGIISLLTSFTQLSMRTYSELMSSSQCTNHIVHITLPSDRSIQVSSFEYNIFSITLSLFPSVTMVNNSGWDRSRPIIVFLQQTRPFYCFRSCSTRSLYLSKCFLSISFSSSSWSITFQTSQYFSSKEFLSSLFCFCLKLKFTLILLETFSWY